MTAILKFGKKHRYAIMSVVLVLLVAVLIVTVVHFYGNTDTDDQSDGSGAPAVSQENASQSRKESGALSGDSSFLVVCADDSGRSIVTAFLLDFKIYSETITVTPLDCSVSYSGRTYAESFAYGGMDMLRDAVENVRNRPVDRYAVLSRKGFISLIDRLGKVTQYVEEGYTYLSSDKSNEVSAGENELEGAMLYTYMKLCAEKNDGLNRTAEMICDIINTYMATLKDADTLALFGDVCNCISTDLTIADYYAAQGDIEYLLSHNTVCVSAQGMTR